MLQQYREYEKMCAGSELFTTVPIFFVIAIALATLYEIVQTTGLGGGGTGCHFDWTHPENGIDQSDAYDNNGRNIVKDAHCCLQLSQLTGDVSDWTSMRNECTTAARAMAPMAPDVFERMLLDGVARESAEPGSGIRLSHANDLHDVLLPQYKAAFLRLMLVLAPAAMRNGVS